MRSDSNTDFKVGIFVTVALLLGTSVIFVVGSQRNVFRDKNSYHAIFQNAAGLRDGNGVRVAGVGAGTVTDVRVLDDGSIRVDFEVVSDVSRLVCADSVARIQGKGMLGDKLLMISAGSGERIADGERVPSEEAMDLPQMIGEIGSMMRDAETILENVRLATGPLGEASFRENMETTVANLATITGHAARGEGVVGRLLSDREVADDLAATVERSVQISAELRQALASVRRITQEIEGGDGSAHQLIYGPSGARLTRELARASAEVASTLGAIRESEGTLNGLIYGDEAGELLENLTAVSADLRHISGEVRAGRGTIGGLLVDPSIYEDVKRLVGDLERNDILRALVRYSIRRDAPATPEAEVETIPAHEAPVVSEEASGSE